VESYQRATGLNIHAACQSYRGNYLDLDPTYKDAWGLLLRMTFEFGENEHKMDYITDRAVEIAQAMGASQVLELRRKGRYDITKYQTTHNVAGRRWAPIRRPAPLTATAELERAERLHWGQLSSHRIPVTTDGHGGSAAYWSVDAIKNAI